MIVIRKSIFVCVVSFVSVLSFAGSTLAEPFPTGDVEAFLGLTSGALDELDNGFITTGSAIRVDFPGQNGGQLTFDWNFITDEFPQEFTTVNDFAFLTITSDFTSPEVIELADVAGGTMFPSSQTEFSFESGFMTFSSNQLTALPSSENYTLGIGTMNVGDDVVTSVTAIDNIRLDGMPLFNGSFESGDLSGFSILGDAFVEDSSFGTIPTDGDFQAIVSATSAVIIPEPSTYALFLVILAGLSWISRNSRRTP